MVENIKKKTIYLINYGKRFFKDHLPHIVFLVFSFQILVAAGALPYFNLISQYSYYVFTATWIIAVLLFRKQITNPFILRGIIFLILIGIATALFGLANLGDAIGFAIFVLLSTYAIKVVNKEKKNL